MKTRMHGARLLLSAGTVVTLAIGTLAAGLTAYAAGPAPVGLGTAAPFAVLAGTPKVTNTGPTVITGDLGISPGAAVTGFPPGIVNGEIHKADAVAVNAKIDLVTAYEDAAGRPVTATHGTLGGLTLVAGVYNAGGVVLDLTGTLTLDGQDDPSSVWVFQATSSLVTASSSSVKLINGASSCNVFWQVTSSATLGSGSTFVGTIMAKQSITMDAGVTVDGRALARNGKVTLDSDTITNTCSATLPGAPTNVTATAGNGRATVSFSPPLSNGGSPITSYTVTSTPGGLTATGTSSPITVTGLTNGTAYTFTVHATNAVGSGPESSPSSSVTPTPRPGSSPSDTQPATDALATTDVPGPGPTPVVFIGIILLAFIVVASRRWLRAIRPR